MKTVPVDSDCKIAHTWQLHKVSESEHLPWVSIGIYVTCC